MDEPEPRLRSAPATPPSSDLRFAPDASALEVSALEDDRWNAELQVHALPTDPYLGLSLTEARALASSEGRVIEDITGADAVTAEFGPARIRVQLDSVGRVTTASAG